MLNCLRLTQNVIDLESITTFLLCKSIKLLERFQNVAEHCELEGQQKSWEISNIE
jgi:hypothetical protein